MWSTSYTQSQGPTVLSPVGKEDTGEEEAKYKASGLPRMPKNPIKATTVPHDEVVKRVKDGHYGGKVRDLCYGQSNDEEDMDMDSIKRTLFLGGRDFGHGVWNDKARNERMEELVGLDENSKPGAFRRFEDLLSGCDDQDLINETIGAKRNERYENHGEATGKTYKELYGQQVVVILRYLQQEGAFGFLSNEDMEKLVYFFRFQFHGTCYLANIVVVVSYYGQKAVDFESVQYPLDVGQLIRAFEDKKLYQYIINDNGGDSDDTFKKILRQLGFPTNCFSTVSCDILEDPDFNFKGMLQRGGAGIVCYFECTKAFHAGYRTNPEYQSNGSKSDTHIGLPRFDMKEGQDFEDVQAEWVELKAQRGPDSNTDDEIQRQIQLAQEKTKATSSSSLSDSLGGEETTSRTNVRRRGDGSAPMHWQQAPDGKQPSPCSQTVAISHENDNLEVLRQLDGSTDVARNEESNLSQVRDRPPAEEEEDSLMQ